MLRETAVSREHEYAENLSRPRRATNSTSSTTLRAAAPRLSDKQVQRLELQRYGRRLPLKPEPENVPPGERHGGVAAKVAKTARELRQVKAHVAGLEQASI